MIQAFITETGFETFLAELRTKLGVRDSKAACVHCCSCHREALNFVYDCLHEHLDLFYEGVHKSCLYPPEIVLDRISSSIEGGHFALGDLETILEYVYLALGGKARKKTHRY